MYLTLAPIAQCLKSPTQEDFFYLFILRYVICIPSCQEEFFKLKRSYLEISLGLRFTCNNYDLDERLKKN